MSSTQLPIDTRATLRIVTFRLLPILMVLYFMSYVDRVNVSFAAIEMNADLGMSTAAYGLGAGLFFIGYFIFEVPSNILLDKFGARVWITRIVISWGTIAGLMAFVNGETMFYVLRFLLGIAEAGFFPGIVYFLGIWFPRQQRARILSYVYMAAPISFLMGGPLSAFLMEIGNSHESFTGWRFMFATEGIITVVLGIVGFFFLVDRPSKAKWLSAAEAQDLEEKISGEDKEIAAVHGAGTLKKAFTPRVFALAFVYFGIAWGIYGIGFLLPLAISDFQTQFGLELSLLQVGLISAIPYAFAAVAMFLWSKHSDRTNERFKHVAIAAAAGGIALTLAFTFDSPYAIMAAVTVTAIGMFSTIPVFWQIPSLFLTGAAAAAGIGIINSIGNLAGFFAPYIIGGLKDATGSYQAGMLLAGLFIVSASVAVLLIRTRLRRAGEATREVRVIPQEINN
ncbi:MFS transporter [Pseudoclavibacter sp. RFBG4]|nr:MFS transporter [Pseudoclavibacter sp. RFBG4]